MASSISVVTVGSAMEHGCRKQPRWWPWGLIAVLLGGCNDPCIIPPCGPPLAIELDVSAANAPNGVSGLRLTVNGSTDGSAYCTPGPITHCYVLGTAGEYHLELSALGYVPVKLGATVVAATDGGCGSCHQVETAQLSVIMQPGGT